jgi:hypothetical protein
MMAGIPINPNGGIRQGLSTNTFSDAGQSVSDIFAGIGDQYKAEGAQFEQTNYLEAEQLAKQEAEFTAQSTAIKQGQADRQMFTSTGRTTAAVANAGLEQGGSALDILRESAMEGSITKAVIGAQGQITEAGYQEQAESYANMASAAGVAEKADKLSEFGSFAAAGIQAVSAMATL